MKSFKNRHIISIHDLTKDEMVHVLETAFKIEKQGRLGGANRLLRGKVLANLFFEPSTRTMFSFATAMEKIGGSVLTFADVTATSLKKGESMKDTIKILSGYSDVIVIRHPEEGAARYASECSDVPVLNAGDGSNQHPTQTLLDLFTIKKTQGHITDLRVAMVGDLKYGRTVHSLAYALSLFNCTLHFVAPPELKMPEEFKKIVAENGCTFFEHEKVEDVIDKVDILYSCRIQKERFFDPIEYEKVKNAFVITKKMLKNVKPNFKIMHPLPRITEISTDVDKTPYAIYFDQAKNGIPVRQALLALVLGAVK
ncbi:aspartate carbamoyltransferase [Candidatus Woesearchaeota archaeon]|nr:aspartate carbamoyltransferase [Candidatus Woesearchaeota archaeon]MBW3013837.1 aspartate carbamoyltransferase [Candidatus Woesearchaeota archaeon]